MNRETMIEFIINDFNKTLQEKDIGKAIKRIGNARPQRDYIKLITSFLNTLKRKKKGLTVSERLYCLINNIDNPDELPKCKICNDYASFLDFHKGYSDTCCTRCSGKYRTKIEAEQNGGQFRFQTKEFKVKSNNSFKEKYGVENAMHLESVKEKQKSTMMKKYGVENCSQADVIKQKKINTSLKKYGTEFPWQTDEGKLHQKQGVRNKYGVDNISQLDFIKDKKEETSMKNWGVRNPSQHPHVRKKILEANGKEYKLPSGKIILIESEVESTILNKILKNKHNELQLNIQPIEQRFKYKLNNKDHYWFPDLLIDYKYAIEMKCLEAISIEKTLWEQLNSCEKIFINRLYILDHRSIEDNNLIIIEHMAKPYNWKCINPEVITPKIKNRLLRYNFILNL